LGDADSTLKRKEAMGGGARSDEKKENRRLKLLGQNVEGTGSKHLPDGASQDGQARTEDESLWG